MKKELDEFELLHISASEILQMLLVAFIKRREWERLRKALDVPLFIDAARSLHEHPALLGASILHLSLRNGASVAMVRGIMKRFPEILFSFDSMGWSPLHAACVAGSSSDIVVMLARACPRACLAQDRKGRLPLHYACGASPGLCDEPHYANAGAVFCLVSLAPSSVHIEDAGAANAIEAAIISYADLKIISFLQDVSVADHLKRQGRLDREIVAKWSLATFMRWC